MRFAAVFVGLVNLAILAALNGVGTAARRGDLTLDYALPVVLAVILAGLLTSEVSSGGSWSALSERFSNRYGISVFAVCVGGAVTGGLLVFVLTLERVLVPGLPSVPALVLAALYIGFFGAL